MSTLATEHASHASAEQYVADQVVCPHALLYLHVLETGAVHHASDTDDTHTPV